MLCKYVVLCSLMVRNVMLSYVTWYYVILSEILVEH